MPSLTLENKLIYFAHCPKAGGTSVEKFMVETWGSAVGHLGWGWDRKWAAREVGPQDIQSSPQHMIWSDAACVLPRIPDQSFVVVRDPVSRLVSEYRYQRSARLTGPFGCVIRGLPFWLWLPLMFAVYDRNPYAYDNHFRPQTEFLPEGPVRVFKLEDGLEPVFDWLSREADLAMKASPDLRELSSKKSEDVVVSRESLEQIKTRYLSDYEKFSYALPDYNAPNMPRRAALSTRIARVLAPSVDWLYRRGLV